MVNQQFIARVSAKNGNTLHKTGVHDTREEAAKAAFEAKPKARKCSTCIAHNGEESHRDIRWHNKHEMKESEMKETTETKRRGIAYLLEDALQKSEVVLLSQGIVDELQSAAEDLSTIEAKKIMPLSDQLITAFGTDVASKFTQVATDQIRGLITAIQTAKSSIDQEILRMKSGIEGGDMSDMSMDSEPPMDAPAGPDEGPILPPTEGGLPEEPPADDAEIDGAIDGGFAGREKKESAKIRGKRIKENKEIKEDFLSGASTAPHKSSNFAPNMSILAHFHGKAGMMGKKIENMIDTEQLTGEQRKSLSQVLSHFAAFSSDKSHWNDAEAKLDQSLKGAGLWDTSEPALAKIVKELRKLAHFIAFTHEGMFESAAVRYLRTSRDPDALVLQMFRTKLKETKDAQLAAIRTARIFSIDLNDVVSVIREAKGNSVRRLKEFKLNTPKSDKGMFKGKTLAQLETERDGVEGKIDAAKEGGAEHKRLTKELERIDFAIRAHKSKGGKGWHKKVNEVDLMQDTPMYPIDAGQNQMQQPGKPVTPQTPADMRANQQAQTSANQASPTRPAGFTPPNANNRSTAAPAPTGGQPMVPPDEKQANMPPSAQMKRAPATNVNTQSRPNAQRNPNYPNR